MGSSTTMTTTATASSHSPMVSTTERPPRTDVWERLSQALSRNSLIKINFSQRGLRSSDARIIGLAIARNESLVSLRLAYNELGDAGLTILAPSLVQHPHLESIDLGFNSIGDAGALALERALTERNTTTTTSISSSSSSSTPPWRTLYLAGNNLGEAGATAIARILHGTHYLTRLHLAGNRIGPDGVRAIADAALELEHQQNNNSNSNQTNNSNSSKSTATEQPQDAHRRTKGVEELFLGGTGMGVIGCSALARLLAGSASLRVLSLSNCDIGNTQLAVLASSILSNRDRLPLERLQLSFNRISSLGIENLVKAIWDVPHLKELVLDNNEICDRGMQLVAAVLPRLPNLEKLHVGFNRFQSPGILALMKHLGGAVCLGEISVCGNTVDTDAAKAIAGALAYTETMHTVSLVRCAIAHEAQRHIAAGIVSNRRIRLRRLNGFPLGSVVVTLGFPAPLADWTNDQVLEFVARMWNKYEDDNEGEAASSSSTERQRPLEAAVVVEAAKKAFQDMVDSGEDDGGPKASHNHRGGDDGDYPDDAATEPSFTDAELISPYNRARSFVAPLESSQTTSETPDKARTKLLSDWLRDQRDQLKKLSRQPFSSKELWSLHQHYFSPVVNECGGSCSGGAGVVSTPLSSVSGSSTPETQPATLASSLNPAETFSDSSEEGSFVPNHTSLSSTSGASSPADVSSSMPAMKRKVSYRFLGDAAAATSSAPAMRAAAASDGNRRGPTSSSVSILIENGPSGHHSLPPKSKRARRNRTRISFLPRIKEKLASSLDVCHEQALTTMRQLYFVETSILGGQVDPTVAPGSREHLSGEWAKDAERMLMDLM